MRTRMVVINEKQGAVEVDCKIVNLVIEMNNSGFVTFASCQGHEFPVDIIKPYIAFRAPVEIVARLERNLREDIESLNGKLNWFWSIRHSAPFSGIKLPISFSENIHDCLVNRI